MKPFCDPSKELSDELSPQELINMGICPSWVLPSDSILGRCLPSTLAQMNITSKLTKKADGKPGIESKLIHSIKYIINTLLDLSKISIIGTIQ